MLARTELRQKEVLVIAMSEVRKTTFKIVSLYVLSTMVFLGIIFGTWYFGEIDTLKTRSFPEAKKLSKRLLSILERRGKYAYYVHTEEGKKALLQAAAFDMGRQIMVFDEEGRVLYNNTRFIAEDIPREEGIFIVDDHTVLNFYGRPDFLHSKDKNFLKQKHFRDVFRIVIDGGNVGDLLWKLRLKVWGLFGLSVLMVGVVGFFLVRFALRPLKQKIEELNCFIKDTTHEINTPLSVLQMSIERIDQDKIPQEEFKKIRYIQTASKTLENIYHSLVYISFGGLEKQIENIDMQKLVVQRLDFFSFLFAQKEIRVWTQFSPSYLIADERAIALVLDNLLSNAYKYTHKKGEVRVILEENEGDATLKIKDNGIGIKQEDLEKIFERYQRFEEGSGGFGLGLNIVKRVCDEFGIKLFVKSEYGEGSEFVLSWKNEQKEHRKN